MIRQKKWITPPHVSFLKAELLLSYLGNPERPVLLSGPPGTGKSVLVHLLKEEIHNQKSSTGLFILDCRVEHERFLSKLYGYIEKGGSPANHAEHPGLIDYANRGMLLLDHVEYLSKKQQAELIPFLAERRYSRVADFRMRNADDVFIMATTTKNDDYFEPGFLKCFQQYYLSPLHSRRYDTLFYLYNEYPEVVRTLTPAEILILLAHNWPDNLWDIKAIGGLLNQNLLIWTDCKKNQTYYEVAKARRFLQIKELNESLRPETLISLSDSLKNSGVDIRALESLLNHRLVGLSFDNRCMPFADFPQRMGALIETALCGLETMCELFSQDISSNMNLLNVNQCGAFHGLHPIRMLRCEEDQAHNQLYLSILEKYRALKIPKIDPSKCNVEDAHDFLRYLQENNPASTFLDAIHNLYRPTAGTSNTIEDTPRRNVSSKKPISSDTIEPSFVLDSIRPMLYQDNADTIPLDADIYMVLRALLRERQVEEDGGHLRGVNLKYRKLKPTIGYVTDTEIVAVLSLVERQNEEENRSHRKRKRIQDIDKSNPEQIRRTVKNFQTRFRRFFDKANVNWRTLIRREEALVGYVRGPGWHRTPIFPSEKEMDKQRRALEAVEIPSDKIPNGELCSKIDAIENEQIDEIDRKRR